MPERVRFVLAVIVQVVVLAAAPLARLEALTAGTRVVLETAPVDPYDVLAGYHVTLSYQIEREASADFDGPDGPVWLRLAPGEPGWRLIDVETTPGGRRDVRVRAEADGGRIRIVDAGRMYVSEAERTEVEAALREAERPARVELRVAGDGTAVVRRLLVGDRVFGADF
jgi:uncharacterized membrane-anchored protein